MTRVVQRALAGLLLLVIAVVCHTAMSSSALAQTALTVPVRALPAITASDSAAVPTSTAPVGTAPGSDETTSVGRSARFPVPAAGGGRVIDTDPGDDGGPTCPVWHHAPPHDSSVADSSRPVGLGDECPQPAGLGGLLAYQPLPGSDAIAELAAAGRIAAPRGAEVCLLHCISRS
ncbi:hypothetical protein [Pseudonocardia sp. KRD291]|uniref:hypothetical protein n=1 Tax=Pseudonocardia sp. KRD291 TaxID=2792007 RepID=UPI001C4A5CD4|nr:hypothetical protein [Pseudonocardia sp. KRD291]MBW0102143.1 hypothetical protein [Pseudonocardia sp. KRD291]